MRIEIDEAKFVEIWAVPVGSKTEQIIGLATRTYNGSDRWMYQWNTRNIPNGEYTLFARVKNSFGIYRSNVVRATVYNKPVVEPMTVEQEEETEKIAVAQEVEKEVFKNEEVIKEEPEEEEKVSDSDATADNSSQEIEDEREVDKILEEFSETIDDELKRLISAYRSKDDEAIATAEQRIERLKREIADSVVGPTRTERMLERIDARVNKIVAEYKVLAVKVEALIVERVGADVFKDSDSDGLSDYDERTLYNTDPYSADSDGDGFIDGAEVAQGYDPLDVKREVAVAYESPKEKGVVREDILTVDSIVAVIPDEPSEDLDGVDEGAVISGTALPNSYVTLYIFSTPIVVTVKTQADGSWEYRFDKELEDGEHNIYVGVTDNAGRIVAKSNPFTFVKEAQAFTQVDALAIASTGNNQDDDSLMSTYMIYLILSISVVSIGLVLILLGLHLDTRQRRYKTVINTEEES